MSGSLGGKRRNPAGRSRCSGDGYRPYRNRPWPLITRKGKIVLRILELRKQRGLTPAEAVKSAVGYHKKKRSELIEIEKQERLAQQ